MKWKTSTSTNNANILQQWRIWTLLWRTHRYGLPVNLMEQKCKVSRGKQNMHSSEIPNCCSKAILHFANGFLQGHRAFAEIALRCCSRNRNDRPSLKTEVIPKLSKLLKDAGGQSQKLKRGLSTKSGKIIPDRYICPITQVSPTQFTWRKSTSLKGTNPSGWFSDRE